MVISSDELERIADDMYLQRGIRESLYCGNCGYNLRTLPHIYRCPECGNEYNARPLKMRGIFLPYEVEPPIGDAAATVFCGLATALLFYYAVSRGDAGLLVISMVFVAMLVVFSVKFTRRLTRFMKAASLLRRIKMDEEE